MKKYGLIGGKRMTIKVPSWLLWALILIFLPNIWHYFWVMLEVLPTGWGEIPLMDEAAASDGFPYGYIPIIVTYYATIFMACNFDIGFKVRLPFTLHWEKGTLMFTYIGLNKDDTHKTH